MISAKVDAQGNHSVLVGFRSPSVYLDTCALGALASDVSKAKAFGDLLREKNGTLLISSANVIELGRMMGESLRRAGQLLDQIGTDWFPINCNAVRVIEREKEPTDQPACLDEVFFNAYYPHTYENPTLTKLIELVEGDKEKFDTMHRRSEPLAADIMKKRKEFKKETPGFNLDAYLTPTYDPKAPTEYIYNGLMRYAFESEMKIEKNDIFDIWHCSVPLAYANFVLIDKTWCNIAKTRLKQLPVGEQWIFDSRFIDEFLKTLEKVIVTD